MIDLAALESRFRSQGSPLTLAASDTALPAELRAFLAAVPNGSLTLAPPADGIRLDGQTLTVTGTSADTWPVRGLTGVTVALTTGTITIANASGSSAVTGVATGSLPVAGHQVAAALTSTAIQAVPAWTLTLGGPASGLRASDLLALGQGGQLAGPTVPAGLDVLDAAVTIAPAGFVLTFFPGTEFEPWLTVALQVPGARWALIEQILEFDGIEIDMFLGPGSYSVALTSYLTIDNIGVAVTVGMSGGSHWIAAVRPKDDTAFPGLAALAGWLCGAASGVANRAQQGFQGSGFDLGAFDLAISSVRVGFDISRRSLDFVEVVSLLTIRAVQLDVAVRLPDLSIQGGLHGNQPLNIASVLASFGLATDGVPAKLTVSQADFSAQPGHGTFAIDLILDDLWDIGPLAIEQVAVSVSRDSTGQFTGGVSGVVRVGESSWLTVGAGYDGPPAGWSFAGGTLGNSGLQVGELITLLASKFGITEVPGAVRSLTLTNVLLAYQTGTGTFTFTCEADFTVEATPVAVVVTIKVAPSAQAPVATDADPHVAVTEGTEGYSATFTGQVTFAGLQFDIVFDMADTGTDVLIADYVHTGPAPVELRALVAGVSAELAQAIPAGISIGLEEVKFAFLKQTASQWAFGLRLGARINLNELPIVGSKLPQDQTLAIENLQILYSRAELVADQTAIINPLLPAGVAKLPDAVGQGISIDADVKLGATQQHLHAGVTPPAPAPQTPQALEAAQALEARQALEAAAAVLPAAAGPPSAAVTPRLGAAPVPASSTDPVKWLDVNKQFGIFSFERVGVGYQDNVLLFALDASVALGPLAFSMQALTVGSPLTKFEPEFSLKGLALSFDRPPIAVGGAFLKVRETVAGQEFDSYYGELIVQAATFSLKALGGWAPDADPASFFIYLSINVPLGGPPFLFVTGLAGGFGINSRLILPTIDEVGSYPLLPAHAPPEQATPAQTIQAVIPALQHTFEPQAGQYWVAAGIAFTSFEMIEAQAVISVAFGVDLQIGVVGTCAMTFPTGDPYPVAYVEIDVVASFTPSTGLLAVDGKLSPASYLFGGFVKLTGGFAFYAWFSGEHQGDFVVSLGGYHPAFDKPANYPAVPRLALAFSLGPVKVVGQAYFALTPSMFMAGIRLSATFEAGPIKAWFDAGVDFLIAWAPFHYEAEAWVTIGCSVDLGLFTLSVQIGADLQLWGPAFGGEALVDLDVVSFTIGFGAARSAPDPVGWSTFAANFLPPPETAPQPAALLAHAVAAAAQAAAPAAAQQAPVPNIIKATVTAGLIPQSSPGVDWILDPDQFRILTASTIPANHGGWSTSAAQTAELPNVVADYQRVAASPQVAAAAAPAPAPAEMLLQLDHGTVTYSDSQVWAPTLDIAPMDETDVASYHSITLRKRDESGDLTDYVTGVTVAPQLGASNTALWGVKAPDDGPNAQRLISATLTGFAISPVPRHPDQVSDVPLQALIFGEGNSTGFGYQAPVVDQRFTVTSTLSPDGQTFTIDVAGDHTATLENYGYELSALTDPWVTSQRSATLDELRRLGFTTAAGQAVHLGTMAETALTDWPGTSRIGSETRA
jgi:hypothetical protein